MERKEQTIATAISTQKAWERMSDGEDRPWGSFQNLAKGGRWHVKVIQVEANKRLSLQSHEKREEYMMLLDGDVEITRELQGGMSTEEMAHGNAYAIKVGKKHRLSSQNGGRVLEVSFGEFEEGDIIRYEDDYGRVGQ